MRWARRRFGPAKESGCGQWSARGVSPGGCSRGGLFQRGHGGWDEEGRWMGVVMRVDASFGWCLDGRLLVGGVGLVALRLIDDEMCL